MTVVCKYGGSSLATLDKIAAIAQAVATRHRRGERVVVVCSAMGAATDNLLQQAHLLSSGAPARELDMLVTCGERTSVALLAIALDAAGVPALSLTGSQAGIVTDEVHQAATIVAVRPHRIERGLQQGRVVVVAGYQGVSRAQEVTTLGRGGSDVTAVALGAALGAREVLLYSDVDGVYSADPRWIDAPVHLPTLSYETLHALALGGAKVVCAEAVRLAEALGIVIVARSAHGSAPGEVSQGPPRQTRIEPQMPAQSAGVAARAGAGEGMLAGAPACAVALLPTVWILRSTDRDGPKAAQKVLDALAATAELVAVADTAVVVRLRAQAKSAALQAQVSTFVQQNPGTLAAEVAWLTAAGPGVHAGAFAGLCAQLADAGIEVLYYQVTARLVQLAIAPAQAQAALGCVHAALLATAP